MEPGARDSVLSYWLEGLISIRGFVIDAALKDAGILPSLVVTVVIKIKGTVVRQYAGGEAL